MRNVLFIFTICAYATLNTQMSNAGERINAWKDADGVTHFSDFSPSVQHANWTPPQKSKLDRSTVHEQISSKLLNSAEKFIPKLCAKRNKNNSAQQAACEKYQQQLVEQINSFLLTNTDPKDAFHFQRCQRKWSKTRDGNFVHLARCLGLS